MAFSANGQPVRPPGQQARRNSEGCERTVDEQKAHVEGPNAAQHKIGDVVAGVDRSIGDRGEDRDGAGGEENGALAAGVALPQSLLKIVRYGPNEAAQMKSRHWRPTNDGLVRAATRKAAIVSWINVVNKSLSAAN